MLHVIFFLTQVTKILTSKYFFRPVNFIISLVHLTSKIFFISKTLIHYVPSLAPPWGQNPYPGDHQIYNFGRGLPALHHHAFSFSQACAVIKKKIFEYWSLLGSFCPAPRAPGCKRFEIYNLCAPCPKNTSYQI